jgi:pancreatic triacylglycerol lipase
MLVFYQADVNVIAIVWTKGAYDGYSQAVANTRVVGALLANMVNFLHNATNLDYGSVHLIGHSLGAHACGYAGERLPGLGRITGFCKLIVQLMN